MLLLNKTTTHEHTVIFKENIKISHHQQSKLKLLYLLLCSITDAQLSGLLGVRKKAKTKKMVMLKWVLVPGLRAFQPFALKISR